MTRELVGYERVHIAVSDELIAELQKDWSGPFRAKIERSEAEPYGYRMTLQTTDLMHENVRLRQELAEAERHIEYMQWCECGCIGAGSPPDDWKPQ